jgi:hypothetical protein
LAAQRCGNFEESSMSRLRNSDTLMTLESGLMQAYVSGAVHQERLEGA